MTARELASQPASRANRWPGPVAVAACALAAAVAVALDAYWSAQAGYLSRPPDYDGISYILSAHGPYLMVLGFHLKTAAHDLATTVSPLWVTLMALHQLLLGGGYWQAFTTRFWPVALLLVLVYWIVSRRTNPWLGAAAAGLTALLPLVSPGVRASSLEWITGQATYYEHWGLDDLRPDFLALALTMWSVAALTEHSDQPRLSGYVASGAFAAGAVLAKTSTAPAALVAWGIALVLGWWWNRRRPETLRLSIFAVLTIVVLLTPWALFAHGLQTVVSYLKAIVAFHQAYASPGGVVGGFTYFLARIPTQLGPIESWLVIAGSLVAAFVLVGRREGRAELVYALVAVFFYVLFSLPPSKNPQIGMWISTAIWIFFWAAGSRVATVRWPRVLASRMPAALGVVAGYTLIVYGLGAVALYAWPQNEKDSNAELTAVTQAVAQELKADRITPNDCFTYVPGPGWPSTILYLLMDKDGAAPSNTAIDVDPTQTSVESYLAAAQRCRFILVYEDPITKVGQVFFAPTVRQPYLEAVAAWARSGGMPLKQSWTLTDLAPAGPHPLGRFTGVTLTIDLYLNPLLAGSTTSSS